MTREPKKTGVITGPLAALKLAQIVAYDSTLHDAAKRVFILIAGYADKDGTCWPSVKKMAKNLGKSRQAVIKQINTLIDHDYLERKERYSYDGRRRSNIYQLNLLLANTHQREPEVFCKYNVTLMVTYLVTILRYKDMQPYQVTSNVSLLSDPNITTIKKQKEYKQKEYNKAVSVILKRKKTHANSWEEQKERDKAMGITTEHKKKIKELSDQIRLRKDSFQMVQFETEIRNKAKELKLSPLEKVEFTIKELENDLKVFHESGF